MGNTFVRHKNKKAMNLKQILLINAISSGVTGILLVIMPHVFATIFKIYQTAPFTFTGWFLILFALFVMVTAFRTAVYAKWTRIIIGVDTLWVIVSIIAALALFPLISIVGIIIILAVAGWVGLMAYLQNKSLKNLGNYAAY